MKCFKIPTTSAVVLELGNSEGKQLVAAKAPNCFTKRVIASRVPRESATPALLIEIWQTNDIEHIFSQEISPMKERTKKENTSPTEAQRELWKSTYYLNQTTAGGAGTVAPTKHPDMPETKEWHRVHVRRKRRNTSTQPLTSSSQWQDWSGWQDWTNSSPSSKRW